VAYHLVDRRSRDLIEFIPYPRGFASPNPIPAPRGEGTGSPGAARIWETIASTGCAASKVIASTGASSVANWLSSIAGFHEDRGLAATGDPHHDDHDDVGPHRAVLCHHLRPHAFRARKNFGGSRYLKRTGAR